jgi:tetratricopeptide (TPR) repeat protein
MNGVQRDLQAGNAAAAIPILRRVLAANGRDYDAHLALGDAYFESRKYAEAADEYTAASLVNPATAEPILARVRAHLAQGDGPAAARDVADAERLEPNTDDTWYARGMVSEQRGDTAEALRDYSSAFAANRSNTQARARLAALALRLGVYDKAREQFEALLRLHYRPSRMHFGLGQVARAQGDAAAAAAEYRKALELEPTFAEARAALRQLGVQ